MTIQHVNRHGKTYCLHQGKTKTGKPKWYFSMEPEGDLAECIPAGYEIYEKPNAQVFLRKIVPTLVTKEEVAAVEDGVRNRAGLTAFIVEAKKDTIIVHLAEDHGDALARIGGLMGLGSLDRLFPDLRYSSTYLPMMKFILVDEKSRRFHVERWCFKGSIDDWFPLMGSGTLSQMVAKYTPHLGKESFFQLM